MIIKQPSSLTLLTIPPTPPLYNRVLIKNINEFGKLMTVLTESSLWSRIQSLFGDRIDPMNALYNIILYPFDIEAHDNPHVADSATIITLVEGGTFTWPEGYEIYPNYNNIISGGDIDFSPSEWLSGSSYTEMFGSTFSVYIPFYGYTPVEASMALNRRLSLRYIIDFVTGKACVLLFSSVIGTTSLDNLVFQSEIQLGTIYNVIPSRTEGTSLVNSLSSLTTTLQNTKPEAPTKKDAPVPVVSGTIPGLAVSAAMTLAGGLGGTVPSPSGTISGNYLSTKAFLVVNIATANEYYDDTYGDVGALRGRPLYSTVILGDYAGQYLEVGQVHLDNFGSATSSEVDEIASLLKAGVIM